MTDDWDLISVDVAEPRYGIQVGKTVLKTHGISACAGDVCCIHNPTDHHMRTWSQNWRGDWGIMERFCPHGIGHPDPDDYKIRNKDGWGVHSCDGCCRRPE